ncbi:diadenylate cyclase [Clostridium acidisoli DSM 12555]|jgi:diadenylate cyclase|uniref:Diadenylate cyclase n=1 Tax=Clostridium acidisoli DSM 12555 TaxID=1121291 RepID=A0A1W1XTA3_9CLOT|nr:diadenylate cyclase CdaA [Clostridium acidisoli]SMC27082.1 diadenylate cyclase [Clostridium acidisoli DSM 12555]
MDIINIIVAAVKTINISTVLDIAVVSYIFYKAYMLIKETRGEQLLKGILLIILLIPISSILHLTMLNWILQRTITIGVLSIIIIFQPEIRRVLEHLGRSAFNDFHVFEDKEKMDEVITQILNAVFNLSETRTGALIVLEQRTKLEDIMKTGTKIDADVSSALLENIFVVNTPLHDGATIIRNNRIAASGCFLPLSSNYDISKKLGTRHRAGIGISENSDSLVIIVSEETGAVSLAINGKLTRNYTKDKLKDILLRIILIRFSKKDSFKEKVKMWKRKIIGKY